MSARDRRNSSDVAASDLDRGRNPESPAHVEYVLRLGDNALILGQRLSEWCGHAPVLEEDLALANVALDLLGQTRLLLTHAGELEGAGRDEDQIAFLRSESDYRNVTLVELPNGDFAQTIARNLLFSAFTAELWSALRKSSDAALAEMAQKSLDETHSHLRHASNWVVRLGEGTAESHARAQAALDFLWPYTAELFTDDAVDTQVCIGAIAPACSALTPGWLSTITNVLEEATLRIPDNNALESRGKAGIHSEHMAPLLADLQHLQRTYPSGTW